MSYKKNNRNFKKDVYEANLEILNELSEWLFNQPCSYENFLEINHLTQTGRLTFKQFLNQLKQIEVETNYNPYQDY